MITLIKHIPYDSKKYDPWTGITNMDKERYPYQVIYDKRGVCGEKSKLGAFLLAELGYGTALFNFEEEGEPHQGLGIKCPMEMSVQKTGYCYVETTGPYGVINYDPKEDLEIIKLSGGASYPVNRKSNPYEEPSWSSGVY